MTSCSATTCLRSSVAAVVLALSTATAAEPPKGSPNPDAVEYRKPELVAMTWATGPLSPNRAESRVAWRPDGTKLDAEEFAWIEKDVRGFRNATWNIERTHRPLVLVFRIDERAKSKHSVWPMLRTGDTVINASQTNPASKNFLAASVVTPQLGEFAKWPSEVDIDLQWPIAEAELFRQIDGVPGEVIKIAPGVSWFSEGDRCVLEVSKQEADPLMTYSFISHFEGGTSEGAWFSSTSRRGPFEIRRTGSRPTEDGDRLKSTDLFRVRYRRERIEKVPTFPELMLR